MSARGTIGSLPGNLVGEPVRSHLLAWMIDHQVQERPCAARDSDVKGCSALAVSLGQLGIVPVTRAPIMLLSYRVIIVEQYNLLRAVLQCKPPELSADR